MECGRNVKLVDKEKEKQIKQATGKASTKPATSISVEEETKDSEKEKVTTEAMQGVKKNVPSKVETRLKLKLIATGWEKLTKKATGKASTKPASSFAKEPEPAPSSSSTAVAIASSPVTPAASSKARPRTKPDAEQFRASSKARPRTNPEAAQRSQVGVGGTGGPDGPKKIGRPKGSTTKPI